MELLKDIKNIKHDLRSLRNFGLTMGIILGGILFFVYLLQGFLYYPLLGVSLFFLGFGICLPRALKPLHFVWMSLALVMGWVVTRVILSLLFYFILTPISLCARLVGKRFLDLSFKDGKTSYWIPCQAHPKGDKKYEVQF